MKHLAWLLVACGALLRQTDAAQRPNILLILPDQMRAIISGIKYRSLRVVGILLPKESSCVTCS